MQNPGSASNSWPVGPCLIAVMGQNRKQELGCMWDPACGSPLTGRPGNGKNVHRARENGTIILGPQPGHAKLRHPCKPQLSQSDFFVQGLQSS